MKDLKTIKFPGLEDVYKIPEGGSGGTGQDGKDGITPTIGENGNWYLGDEDTGKPSRGETGPAGPDGAPGKDGSPGKDGAPGKDGVTPTIGENGNWYLGDEDTGKPSRGATGQQGADGKDGTNGTDGTDGHTPVITASKSGKVTTIKVDGEAVATVNDGADGKNGTDGAPGKDGADGAPGKDGVTPDIKIGTVTTLPAGSAATASMGGTAAQPTLNLGIPKGANGDNANVTKDAVVGALGFTPISADDVPVKSVNGATGEVKSAFYVTVTQGDDGSVTADKTLEEICTAHERGYAVYAKTTTLPQVIVPLTIAMHSGNYYMVAFNGNVNFGDTIDYTIANEGNGWEFLSQSIAFKDDIPTALKNPHPLNIKIGNTTTSYDGSAAKTVEIPKGVPAVTTADNGKILRVVNGAWAAAAIDNANGGSF